MAQVTRAADSYPEMARYALNNAGPLHSEVMRALVEIDKWRKQDADDEACYEIMMDDGS